MFLTLAKLAVVVVEAEQLQPSLFIGRQGRFAGEIFLVACLGCARVKLPSGNELAFAVACAYLNSAGGGAELGATMAVQRSSDLALPCVRGEPRGERRWQCREASVGPVMPFILIHFAGMRRWQHSQGDVRRPRIPIIVTLEKTKMTGGVIMSAREKGGEVTGGWGCGVSRTTWGMGDRLRELGR